MLNIGAIKKDNSGKKDGASFEVYLRWIRRKYSTEILKEAVIDNEGLFLRQLSIDMKYIIWRSITC